MPSSGPTTDRDERAISEVVGVTLLFGMVIAGATVVVITGSMTNQKFQEQNRLESATVSMQQLDSELGSLTDRLGEPAVADVDLTDREAEAVTMETGDRLTITLSDDPQCRTTVALDAVRYETPAGSVVYQAGGVWKTTESGTVMVSTPAVDFSKKTLRVSVVDLRGQVDRAFRARKDVADTRELTRRNRTNLFDGGNCYRPDGMELRVESDRYANVWYDYFTQEFPSGVTVTRTGDAVVADVPERLLPERANNSRNTLVDFTDPDGLGTVTDAGSTVQIEVDKADDDNTYNASGKLLGVASSWDKVVEGTEHHEETLKLITEEPEYAWVEVEANQTKWVIDTEAKPLEAVMLADESGSMAGDKIRLTKAGVKAFTRVIPNPDVVEHEVGLVGYSTRLRGSVGGETVRATTRIDATTYHSGVMAAADDIAAGGGTPMGEGMVMAMDQFPRCSNPDKRRMVVLLTDGKHNAGVHPDRAADVAARCGITFHTIAIGYGPNDALLKEIAMRTGGEYHFVANASRLGGVLRRIAFNATHEKVTFDANRTVKVVDGYEEITTNKTIEKTIHGVNYRWIVHDPVVATYETPSMGSPASMVPGDAPEDRAVNYRGSPPENGIELENGEPLNLTAQFYTCNADTDSLAPTGERSSPPSDPDKVYEHMRCTDTNGNNDPVDAEVYVRGDDVPEFGGKEAPPWWQRKFDSMVAPYTGHVDADGNREFTLDRNQVIVVYRYDDDRDGHPEGNTAVMLYEVGDTREQIPADWLVNLRVVAVDAEDG